MTDLTVATLVYRNTSWLDWWKEGLDGAKNSCSYRTLVIANNAETDVANHPLVDLAYESPEGEAVLSHVYRAWNEAVLSAPTQRVVLINNDMYVSDHWLDALLEIKEDNDKTLPCSLLVESGRIPSAMPEHVKDFGLTPSSFDKEGFLAWASDIRDDPVQGTTEPGRLYQPVLVDREEFLDLGGYPEGNQEVKGGTDGPIVVSGDKILFSKYKTAGFEWVTALGSVVYHVQEGEGRDV